MAAPTTQVAGRTVDLVHAAKGAAVIVLAILVAVGVIPYSDAEAGRAIMEGGLGLYAAVYVHPVRR